MSSGRVLKSDQIAEHDVVVLSDTSAQGETTAITESVAARSFAKDDAVEEALLFTASEVEDLCAKARASGAADAAAALEPALTQVAAAMETFVHNREESELDSRRSAANDVVETSMSVARWVLGRELSDPEALIGLVTRALGDHSLNATSILRVHADLVPLLFDIAPNHIDVRADHDLALGEFRVESDGPDVAFRFDTAMDRAAAALSAPEIGVER